MSEWVSVEQGPQASRADGSPGIGLNCKAVGRSWRVVRGSREGGKEEP